MIALILITIATLFVAYFNGANDNFKGVATLLGSKTVNYKTALFLASSTTISGSVFSIIIAEKLLKNFSGKGLVPDLIANDINFHIAVAFGAGLTVMLATLTGFPISTTHALTGGLLGAGLVAIGKDVNIVKLGNSFFFPLIFSPILAIILAGLLYSLVHQVRIKLGLKKAWCICVGNTQQFIPISDKNCQFFSDNTPSLEMDTLENCQQKYMGKFWGIDSQKLVDIIHFISAGIVSFSRGLNDTPKIVALLLIGDVFSLQWVMLVVALAMAIGGVLNAKKIAEIMSHKITHINHGQGLIANLITGVLVIFASQYGLPVSTTHVSVGAIFGVGVVAQKANYSVFSQILLSWVLTLPIATVCGGFIYFLLVIF